MTELTIQDNDLTSLTGKVVVLTGGSSGIGLTATEMLLDLGATVVSGDLNPVPIKHNKLAFVKTDVSSWDDLKALFKHAKDLHGRIDHAFANAGISGRADYLQDNLDDNGELVEPSRLTYEVNLRGAINTAYLGMHHMRHQEPSGGSIVITASASSFQRFEVTDYATSKHGVLGFIRAVHQNLQHSGLPIRINGIAPDWTMTGIIPKEFVEKTGILCQGPEVAAKSALYLMADQSRHGQLIYSVGGHFIEIEEGELLKAQSRIPHMPDIAVSAELIRQAAAAGTSGTKPAQGGLA